MDFYGQNMRFGQAGAHVWCRMGMNLGTPLQHIMLERCTMFHPHPTPNMCAGVSETQFLTIGYPFTFLWSKIVFQMRPRTCSVSDGDETWYASSTHHVGEAYQVSSPSDTEHVRGRVRNAIFIRYVNGFLWSKYAFRTRPCTCSVSDGDESWYASPT